MAAVHRLAFTQLPQVASVERAAAEPSGLLPRGQARGRNARGQEVILDVEAGTVTALDADGAPGRQVKVVCEQDPLTPGLVAVSAAGNHALIMAARALHGDPTLVLIDFDSGRSEVISAASGPGWMTGGFGPLRGEGPGPVICCAQQLGDDPVFTVSVGGRTVWSQAGKQQPCVPVVVKDDLVALLLCLQPDPLTGTGPTSLCLLDLASGAVQALCPARGSQISAEPGAIVVDGGEERVRVSLKP